MRSPSATVCAGPSKQAIVSRELALLARVDKCNGFEATMPEPVRDLQVNASPICKDTQRQKDTKLLEFTALVCRDPLDRKI